MRATTSVQLPTGITVEPTSILRIDDKPIDLKVKITQARISDNGKNVEIGLVVDGIEPHVEFRQDARKHGEGNNHLFVTLGETEH